MLVSRNAGKSFITIMIVTAICALILRIVIKQIIRGNISQNESNAYATLKLVSAALENYAKDNKELYPSSVSVLTKTQPPYLDKEYIPPSSLKGYVFNCSRIEESGYNCYASPIKCNLTGQTTYTIITGGSLISEECSKKE